MSLGPEYVKLLRPYAVDSSALSKSHILEAVMSLHPTCSASHLNRVLRRHQ